MHHGRVVAAVIAAHDEEAHIADVVTGLPDLVDHVVVVDDGSSDGTAAAAEATGAPRLILIRHETNVGVGGAVCTAYRRALETRADLFVRLDGDGQMDPTYIPDLLAPLVDEGIGFAKANRFYSSTSFRGMPAHRVVGNIVLSFLTKLASGYWNLFSPQNGFTAVTRKTLERLDLDQLRRGYEFENDFLVSCNILNVRARDVPVPAVYGDEVSGIRLRRVVPAIFALLVRGLFRRITLKYVIRTFSPVALFLFSGLALVAVGLFWGVYAIIESWGPGTTTTGTVLLAVTPFLMGFQLLLAALQADIAETPK